MHVKTTLKIILLAAALATTAVASAKTYTVKELNNGPAGTFQFDPDFLQIQPGDSVEFVPTDAGHDSKAYLVPDGAKAWQSEIGKPLTVTLDKQGVYLYECQPHHMLGMLGVIQVGKATNKAAAEKAAAEMETKVVTNKGRLTKLMAEVK